MTTAYARRDWKFIQKGNWNGEFNANCGRLRGEYRTRIGKIPTTNLGREYEWVFQELEYWKNTYESDE
jgi:hypothetical protein